MCANLLRVASDSGIRVRDLPGLVRLSSEGVVAALHQLARERLGVIQAGPISRGKILIAHARGTARTRGLRPPD